MATMLEQVEQIGNVQEDIQAELLALSKLIQRQQKSLDEVAKQVQNMRNDMDLLTAPPEPPERPRNDDSGMSRKDWALVAAGIVFLLLLHVLPPIWAVGDVQDTTQRILWNQSYGNTKPVTPFTSSDDFNKEYDNQQQYEEAQAQQKGEK